MATTEVMIKDIVDSKRLDGNIYEDPISRVAGLKKEEPILHGSIISKLFWPNLKNEEFIVPESISKDMQKYEEAFKTVKPRRKLQWLTSLGKVVVELELQDRTLEFEVLPIYATIISHFQIQDKWDLHSLALKMKINPESLQLDRIEETSINFVEEQKTDGTHSL
ncbi:10761_t:CDS:2 [Diversispora eburnea]|uniref:10761_t:CDS:1 n=1 Tax=Diversispora eburnea TaxID=1213867 RepID=A0A9N9A5Q6_9GLOM|nr:10761_t:CDS:2 [Diversispora eburnea]